MSCWLAQIGGSPASLLGATQEELWWWWWFGRTARQCGAAALVVVVVIHVVTAGGWRGAHWGAQQAGACGHCCGGRCFSLLDPAKQCRPPPLWRCMRVAPGCLLHPSHRSSSAGQASLVWPLRPVWARCPTSPRPSAPARPHTSPANEIQVGNSSPTHRRRGASQRSQRVCFVQFARQFRRGSIGAWCMGAMWCVSVCQEVLHIPTSISNSTATCW